MESTNLQIYKSTKPDIKKFGETKDRIIKYRVVLNEDVFGKNDDGYILPYSNYNSLVNWYFKYKLDLKDLNQVIYGKFGLYHNLTNHKEPIIIGGRIETISKHIALAENPDFIVNFIRKCTQGPSVTTKTSSGKTKHFTNGMYGRKMQFIIEYREATSLMVSRAILMSRWAIEATGFRWEKYDLVDYLDYGEDTLKYSNNTILITLTTLINNYGASLSFVDRESGIIRSSHIELDPYAFGYYGYYTSTYFLLADHLLLQSLASPLVGTVDSPGNMVSNSFQAPSGRNSTFSYIDYILFDEITRQGFPGHNLYVKKGKVYRDARGANMKAIANSINESYYDDSLYGYNTLKKNSSNTNNHAMRDATQFDENEIAIVRPILGHNSSTPEEINLSTISSAKRMAARHKIPSEKVEVELILDGNGLRRRVSLDKLVK